VARLVLLVPEAQLVLVAAELVARLVLVVHLVPAAAVLADQMAAVPADKEAPMGAVLVAQAETTVMVVGAGAIAVSDLT